MIFVVSLGNHQVDIWVCKDSTDYQTCASLTYMHSNCSLLIEGNVPFSLFLPFVRWFLCTFPSCPPPSAYLWFRQCEYASLSFTKNYESSSLIILTWASIDIGLNQWDNISRRSMKRLTSFYPDRVRKEHRTSILPMSLHYENTTLVLRHDYRICKRHAKSGQ